MSPAITKKFEKLERQKSAVLSGIAELSIMQLSFRPESASWCVLDVLDHLIKVERASLAAVREQLPSGPSITFRDRVSTMMVNAVMLSPLRVKVPASASMVLPAPGSDLSGLAASWSKVRGQMANLLASLQPEQLRVGLFRHPVAGWMPIGQMLAFLSAHLRHHTYQIDRLKSANKSGKTA